MSRKPNGGTVASIWQRDKARCWICRHAVRKDEASRDHVTPKSAGGYNKGRNYRLAHARCNTARGVLDEATVKAIVDALPRGSTATVVRDALIAERRREIEEARARFAPR